MKRIGLITMIILCMITTTSGQPSIEKFTVTFETYASLDYIWIRDCITNNQDSNDDFPYKTVLNETSINVSTVDVRLFEEKTEEYIEEIPDTVLNEICFVNGTCYNETVITGYHNEARERVILLERNLVQKNEDGKGEISNQFEEVHIKKGETKCFWRLYQLPEVPNHPNGGWGSYGMTYIITKDEIHYDRGNSSWWNTSCNEGTNILIDGNGIARDKTLFWLNVTGTASMSNFTSGSRLVNTTCNNGGSETFMKMHQNGTDSVLITGSTTNVPAGSNGSACFYHDCSFTTPYDMMEFMDIGNISYNGTGYPNVTGSEWADAPGGAGGLAGRDAVDKGHLKLNISSPSGIGGTDYHLYQAFGGTKTKATFCFVIRNEDDGDGTIWQAMARMQGFGTGTETEFRYGMNETTAWSGVAGEIDGPASKNDYHWLCVAIAAKTTGEAWLDAEHIGNISGIEANDQFAFQIGDLSSSGTDVLTTYWSFWWINTTDYLPPPTASVGSSISQPTSILISLVSPANDSTTTDSTPDFTWNITGDFSQASCTVRASNVSGSVYDIYNNATTQNATNTAGTSNITLTEEAWIWWVYCAEWIVNNVSSNYTLTVTAPPAVSYDAFAGITRDNILMRIGCGWDNTTDYCSTGLMAGYNKTTDEILCCLVVEV